MYSCGSLAPRMGRGGCSDAKFRKPPEPWEFADGCVFFVFEVSSIPGSSKTFFGFLYRDKKCLVALSIWYSQ